MDGRIENRRGGGGGERRERGAGEAEEGAKGRSKALL